MNHAKFTKREKKITGKFNYILVYNILTTCVLVLILINKFLLKN